MDNKIKIAIVGVGGISQMHLKGYTSNPDVEVYAFCDINPDRLRYMGEKYGITRLYTDEDKMLAELPEIDAVSVCTWNCAHAECTIKALNAGKDVLCEKPMSVSVEDAKRMKEAADRNGRLLMLGFVRRYGNDCLVMKDFANNDTFGDIYYSKAQYIRRNGNPGGWFSDKSRSGGGCLIDLGVHVIDYVRYIMGCPKPVSVYGATFQKLFNRSNIKTSYSYAPADGGSKRICDVEDLAVALVRFDNGAVLNIETSFSLNSKERNAIEIFGTKGGAKLVDKLELYTEMNGYMTNVEIVGDTSPDFDVMFNQEINHFVDCVKNKKPCISTAEDGVILMQILMGIYESSQTGHEVIIK